MYTDVDWNDKWARIARDNAENCYNTTLSEPADG
jgi:hypothetical protein